MRVLALLMLTTTMTPSPADHVAPGRGVRLAGLSESVPELFLKLVNDKLKGRIDAGSIRYDAPSSVILQEARLLDPKGAIVARVKKARATLSLSELLSGDIVVSSVELEDPSLDLVIIDKKLNLIEALTPRKPPEKDAKDPQAAFRIDSIHASGAAFTFTDRENITITASGISANASLNIDLAREVVIVDVRSPYVTTGKVMLKELDIPLSAVRAKQVIVYKERVDLYDVSAKALGGASLTASGSVAVKAPGNLSINGFVDAPVGVWPDRLKPLPFELPALKGKVGVSGPFENPLVTADATFNSASAYGYKVDSGRGVVTIKKDLVTIKDGSQVRAGGGVVHAEGTVTLPGKALDLKLRAVDVPLATALMTAKLDPAPKGVITARAHLTGVADGEAPLKIDVHGNARRAEIAGVKARGELAIDAKVTVRPKDKLVAIDGATLKGDGLDAHVDGTIYTEQERVELLVNARIENAPRWVASVPEQIDLASATFIGKIAGPYQTVLVEGAVTGTTGAAYGVPFSDVRAHLAASAQRVTIGGITAHAAGGDVSTSGDIVVELKDKKQLRGVVIAKHIDLALIKNPDGTPLPLRGIADAEAVLAGPYTDPTVTARAAVGGLVVQDEKLGAATARIKTTKKLLTVIDLEVDGPLVKARTGDLRLDIEKMALEGVVSVERIDLGVIEAAKKAELAGTGFGIVRISGDVKAPTLDGDLTVRDLAVGPQKFGDGPIRIGMAPDTVPAKGDAKNHIASISAKLISRIGSWDAAASFAIQRKVVNAQVHFRDVDLEPFTTQLGAAVSPLEGFASGEIEASGPLESLSMRVRLRVPELAVAPYQSVETPAHAVKTLRPLGHLLVDARMDDGELVAKVCAFPAAPASPVPSSTTTQDESPCRSNERVWANVVGSLDPMEGTFDLSIDGIFEERALEDLVPAIAKRGFRVGAKARASAQIARAVAEVEGTRASATTIAAQATLLRATLQPPDEDLRAELVEPADILYDDRRVRLETPAHFKTPNGEIDVTVGGAAGDEDIALDIEGSIALALAKLFTEQIANARGTAQTELSIRGRYDEGIAVEGSITPAPGAVITPRALGQPVQFQEGTVSFAPLEESGGMLRIRADGVRAKIGDGDAQLRGYVDARTARDADEPYIARWDIALTGTGLEFRVPSGRIEGGAELLLTGDEASPLLRGRIEVTDGSYRKVVELKNFVLAAAPGKPVEPLWQTLTPFGLGNLQLDVAVAMQNFRVRFNAPTFNADLMLGGNLRVNKLLRLPAIDGAIEVEEGVLTFPRARFEVIEMQVEFPSTGDGRLNPLVHLTARAEIPPGGAGNNDTEIPVDLALDGDLEKGITLDLTATDPVRQWSRNDLLALVLFGKTSVEQTVADADVGLAFDALLNEASAPLTAELEALAQRTLGVDVEIEATGWRWQLGRRLQVEGEVSLVGGDSSTSTTNASGATSSTAAATSSSGSTTDTVRLRLLFIDHLQPFGKNLSVEGRSSQAGSDLRLSLRIFEE